MTSDNVTRDRGARAGIYNPLTLRLYDAGVLGLTNTMIWRCPTRLLVDHYQRHAGDDHLDIGPGTGYFLERITARSITLLDLNASSLDAAAKRAGTHRVKTTLRQSYFDLLPHGRQYDSIGVNFVLHCILSRAKWPRLDELRENLRPGGTLFGSTIIPDRETATPLARLLHGIYNQLGVFGNDADTIGQLTATLASWDDVTVTRHGQVAIFSARRPQGNQA